MLSPKNLWRNLQSTIRSQNPPLDREDVAFSLSSLPPLPQLPRVRQGLGPLLQRLLPSVRAPLESL
eukprot:3539219-Amphidinium_carterae.1